MKHSHQTPTKWLQWTRLAWELFYKLAPGAAELQPQSRPPALLPRSSQYARTPALLSWAWLKGLAELEEPSCWSMDWYASLFRDTDGKPAGKTKNKTQSSQRHSRTLTQPLTGPMFYSFEFFFNTATNQGCCNVHIKDDPLADIYGSICSNRRQHLVVKYRPNCWKVCQPGDSTALYLLDEEGSWSSKRRTVPVLLCSSQVHHNFIRNSIKVANWREAVKKSPQDP